MACHSHQVQAKFAGELEIHAAIRVRLGDEKVETTVGRILLKEIVPDGIPFEIINQVMDKKALGERFGIAFNHLLTITNMPIHRFALHLHKAGEYQRYMDTLVRAFNPAAAENVMCRTLISVGPDGRLYDCDFNQQLELPIEREGRALTIFDFAPDELLKRRIRVANHCFGCTAGAGSSCGGATT
jgi:radical SAM/Cys-rich protein